MLITATALGLRKDNRIEHLQKLVVAFKQAVYWRKSEKSNPEQFDLTLEDLETAIAAIHIEDETDTNPLQRVSRLHAPNLGCLHCFGDDVSERVDVIPVQFRVIVTHRPQNMHATCHARTDGIVQAPAPAHLIPFGLPAEVTVTHVNVSKYVDYQPVYRQPQIMARHGIELDLSMLVDTVGRAAYELHLVFDTLIADLKPSNKLFIDETRAQVLDPGSRKTKSGYFCALIRD